QRLSHRLCRHAAQAKRAQAGHELPPGQAIIEKLLDQPFHRTSSPSSVRVRFFGPEHQIEERGSARCQERSTPRKSAEAGRRWFVATGWLADCLWPPAGAFRGTAPAANLTAFQRP